MEVERLQAEVDAAQQQNLLLLAEAKCLEEILPEMVRPASHTFRMRESTIRNTRDGLEEISQADSKLYTGSKTNLQRHSFEESRASCRSLRSNYLKRNVKRYELHEQPSSTPRTHTGI